MKAWGGVRVADPGGSSLDTDGQVELSSAAEDASRRLTLHDEERKQEDRNGRYGCIDSR
jgi:hypothetical protein